MTYDPIETLDDLITVARRFEHVLCDANVLCTLVCLYGNVDPAAWGATKGQQPHVAAALRALLDADRPLLVLPTILAETSNLIPKSGSRRRPLLAGLALASSRHLERYTESRDLTGTWVFHELGLADADVWLHEDVLVLSTDDALNQQRWASSRASFDPRTLDV